MEEYEQRLLYSADLAPHALLLADATAATQPVEQRIIDAQGEFVAAQTPAVAQQVELLIVDAAVSDRETLLNQLNTNGRTIEVLILDASTDGISKISAALAARGDIAALHILSHGADGKLQLGNTVLDASALAARSAEIAGWGDALKADADILIYGCDVAADAKGTAFVQQLAALTRADVAASSNLTGSAALGGDWILEYVAGNIARFETLAPGGLVTWQGLLATITVTTTNDTLDGDISSPGNLAKTPGPDGNISLREAIIAANNSVGGDEINLPAGTYKITIPGVEDLGASGDFDITDGLDIIGSGTTTTIIDGNGLERVFHVLNNSSAAFTDLTITNGGKTQGSGVRVDPGTTVEMTRVVLSNNQGSNQGGAIWNEGTLNLTDVRITGSSSTLGGGISNSSLGTVTALGVTIDGNSAVSQGGGIHNAGTLNLTNVTISGNSSAGGSGILNKGSATLTNVTITGNTASSSFGGGILVQAGSATLLNTIVSGNIATKVEDDVSGTVTSLGNNLIGATAGSSGWVVSDLQNVNPLLDPVLRNNGGPTPTHALLAGSPAIDTGASAKTVPATDQRGVARSGTVDIGAYEFKIAPALANASTLNYAENDPATAINAVITVSDLDTPTLDDATVSITGNFVSAQDLLAFSNVPATMGNVAAIYNTGSGVMTLTSAGATATLAQWQAALRAVTYANSSENPSTLARSVSFQVNDGQVENNLSNIVTSTINVTTVNDPPVITLPAAQNVNEDTTLTFSSGNSNLISVSDVDAGSGLVQITLSVTNGTLTLNGTAGLTLVSGGSGTGAMQYSGTLASINAALNGMFYTPTANFNGGSGMGIVISDQGNTGGAAQSDTKGLGITVNPVNDVPVIGGAVAAQAVNDNASVNLFSTLTITDPDLDPLTVTVALDVAAKGVLTAASLAASGFSTADGGLTYTHAAFANAAAAQTEIRKLVFDPTDNRVSPGLTETTTFTVRVSDGVAPLVTNNTTTVVSTSINDEPTLTATPGNPTFTEAAGLGTQAAAVALYSGTAVSTIEAGQTITGLSFTVGGLADGANEKVVVDGSTFSLLSGAAGTTAGNSLTYGVSVAGAAATVTLSKAAGISTVATQNVVNGIAYQNTSTDNPTAGVRTFTLTQLVDSGSNIPPNESTAALSLASTVTVIAVNDGPAATNLNAAEFYTQGFALKLTSIVVSDVDSPNVSVTLTLSDVNAGSLNTATAGAFTSTFAGGVWSASGPIANVNSLLSGLIFTPAATYNSNFSIATSVSDGVAVAVTGVKNVTLDRGLWLSATSTALTSAGSGALSYNDGQIARLTDPNLALGAGTSAGTFSQVFDIDVFAGANTNIVGLHYVSRSVTVGSTNPVTLQMGDVLLSLNSSETLGGVAVTQQNIVLFRPTTLGDYSAGTFSVLIRNPGNTGHNILDFALVEQAMTMGTSPLQPGDFLLTLSSASFESDISLFRPTDMATTPTGGALSVLIDGDGSAGIGNNQKIFGLELVQQATVLGGTLLNQGQILVALDASDVVGTNNLSVTRFDVFALKVTATGAVASSATASMLLRGIDVGLGDAGNSEAIDAIAQVLPLNMAPVLDSNKSPALTAINEEAGPPVGAVGTLVSQLVDFAVPTGQVDNVADADSDALLGLALTGVDSANGAWFYSTTAIPSWLPVPAVSQTNALLLAADNDTQIYFQPAPNYNGTLANAITFRAWDRTSGANGATANPTTSSATVRDQFSTALYSNNNGTATWAGDWAETDSNGGGASGGRIRITSGELRIQVDNTNDEIHRTVNLTGASWATLSLDYNSGIGGAVSMVDVRISGNGGTSYTTLDSFSGTLHTGTGTLSFDISPYIASNTTLQFFVRAGNGSDVNLDNVQIAYGSAGGGSSAFSKDTDTASLVVNAVNDPPVLSDTVDPPAVVELVNATAQNLAPVSGNFAVSDFDIGDTLTPSVVGIPVVQLNGAGFILPATASALTGAGAFNLSVATSNGGVTSIG